MNLFEMISSTIKNPLILQQHQHIFLMSHMRANTSLFGHILGNNKQISGYYEMHIGYYSWKSLYRQKILYSKDHHIDAKTKYFFDKVLHSEHEVKPIILNRANVLTIFSLRKPDTTIPSILKLYEKVDKNHEFATLKGATDYYISRLNGLKKLAEQTDRFIYIDADAIRTNTEQLLTFLTQKLALSEPLRPQYSTKELTGKGNTGDHSENLKAGAVKATTTDYSSFKLAEEVDRELQQIYCSTRLSLIERSESHFLATEENNE
jgi:hypothetical protein